MSAIKTMNLGNTPQTDDNLKSLKEIIDIASDVSSSQYEYYSKLMELAVERNVKLDISYEESARSRYEDIQVSWELNNVPNSTFAERRLVNAFLDYSEHFDLNVEW